MTNYSHIMETSLATELSWDLGSASLESVDMFTQRVCKSLGFVLAQHGPEVLLLLASAVQTVT